MTKVWVQEQKRYTIIELSNLCNITQECIVPIIRKLKEFGILKVVLSKHNQYYESEFNNDDLLVADVEVDSNHFLYFFSFVGVIVIKGIVFYCYPKYVKQIDPQTELKLILKVLNKYNSESETIRLFSEVNENKSFDIISLLLFFIEDYSDNGIYQNQEIKIEYNGHGEIKWDRTINENYALIVDDQPFYTELYTIKHFNNDSEYISRLHKCIITKASHELETTELLELFELLPINLSDEELDDFGDKEYILYRISRELNVQFTTWKKNVLSAMYTYVKNGGCFTGLDSFLLYGSTHFNFVWEHICSIVLDNKLNTPIRYLPLPTQFNGNTNERLIDIIEKPYWTFANKTATDTYTPDIISIKKIDNRYYFIIIDAKYYTPILEPNQTPRNQPGIESISKQYFYQLAYSKFLENYKFDMENVRNCFVIPTDVSNEEEIDKGETYLDMFNNIELQKIQVRYLFASKVYEYYLHSKKLGINELQLNL